MKHFNKAVGKYKPVRNTYNSFTVFMLTLNINYACQVRVIRKIFAFTETWRYITKLHDPNKRKVGLPCFERTCIPRLIVIFFV